jgi:hypothetical protein
VRTISLIYNRGAFFRQSFMSTGGAGAFFFGATGAAVSSDGSLFNGTGEVVSSDGSLFNGTGEVVSSDGFLFGGTVAVVSSDGSSFDGTGAAVGFNGSVVGATGTDVSSVGRGRGNGVSNVPAMSLVVYRQYRCGGKTKWKRYAQFRTEAIVLRSGLAKVPAHLLTPLPASLETERAWWPLVFAPARFPLVARRTSYQVNEN